MVFVTQRGYSEPGLALRQGFVLINFKQPERLDGLGAHRSRIEGLKFDCRSGGVKQVHVDYFGGLNGEAPLWWVGRYRFMMDPDEFVLPAATMETLRTVLC